MDPNESLQQIASLKQTIQDSEASLEQMKRTIRDVDSRLNHTHGNACAGPNVSEDKELARAT